MTDETLLERDRVASPFRTVIGRREAAAAIEAAVMRTLQRAIARAELADLRRRFRRIYRRRNRRLLHALRWDRPGAVWAIDYAEPPSLVEGQYRYLLAVRDRASGEQLAWLPVGQADAATACHLLKALFREHGAPLVLKADNGSPFHAAQTQKLLQQQNVVALFSPVRMPRYNGACEAGIGCGSRAAAMIGTLPAP
jgi:transposase InsO family protein